MNIDGMMPLSDRRYTPGFGNFGVTPLSPANFPMQWYSCREQFHSYADPAGLREFHFAHTPGRGADIARFIYQLERHLDLVEKSLFKYTDRPDVVWVKVAAWWVRNFMRFSFFTCALRGASLWDKTTPVLDWLQNNTAYLNATKPATRRFLDGYTWYTGNIRGWNRQFTGHDLKRQLATKELESLLIRPLFTDRERHNAVAALAKQMWDDAKQPWGRSEEFWFKAAEKIDAKGW